MLDLLRDILALIGLAVLAWGMGSCIRDVLDSAPPRLPRPRDDERDTRRRWDRIQGR